MQLHGGIGFTWEHPAHLYLKRAKSSSIAFGTWDWHRPRSRSWPGSPGPGSTRLGCPDGRPRLPGMRHAVRMTAVATGTLHHIELWVPDLTRAEAAWGWLLGALGYEIYQRWPEGTSWQARDTYIVSSSHLTAARSGTTAAGPG